MLKNQYKQMGQKKRPLATKNDIIKFVNSELNIELKAIEDLGNGVIYCQLFDKIFPGLGLSKKIKLTAKQEWENLSNLKILQSGFEKKKIQKTIEIQKLSKSKFLDNFTFMQWFLQFYEEERLRTFSQSRATLFSQDKLESPEPQKKIKIQEEDNKQNQLLNIDQDEVISFGSFFKASEFKNEGIEQVQETAEPQFFKTNNKDKKDQLFDLSASLLISPVMFKSEMKAINKENKEAVDKINKDDLFPKQDLFDKSEILQELNNDFSLIQ